MPIYEYQCSKCKAQFEVLIRSRSDQPTCPKCGADKPEKMFSAFAVASTGPKLSSGCEECHDTGSSRAPGPCSGGSCPFSR